MSWLSEATIKAVAFPLYAVTLVMLIGVEALGFVSKGAQRWLDIGPIRLQPSRIHEAGDRADAGALLRAGPGRRHPQLAGDLAGADAARRPRRS